MTLSPRILELYKCAVLTVIAVVLVGIYMKTPIPFTFENVRNKKVEMTALPMVRVYGGHVDASVSGSVEIER